MVRIIPDAFKRIRLISDILEKGSCNIIYATSESTFDGLAAAYMKRRYGIPLVFNVINPLQQKWECSKIEGIKPRFLHYLFNKFSTFVCIYVMRKADLVLATTRFLKEELTEKGIPASKVQPYPSVVGVASFSNQNGKNIRQEYALSDSKLIIYVGTLGKPRHLHVLLQAFSKVREERSAKLLMVGDGSDRKNLERLADELGIRDDVIFTGQVPQSEVPHFIATADIGLSPVPPLSFYRVSSPIKLLEYMAMAKPVVASEEILDQKEVLEQSSAGVLVPFIPEAFAKAIIDLLDNPEKAAEMGQRGREWVAKNRSYEVLARELEETLLGLLKTKD
jgi:glycosyltransferase involved in cell wall biosynthesis